MEDQKHFKLNDILFKDQFLQRIMEVSFYKISKDNDLNSLKKILLHIEGMENINLE